MPMFCDTAVLFCEHLFSSEVSDNSGDVSCTKKKTVLDMYRIID